MFVLLALLLVGVSANSGNSACTADNRGLPCQCVANAEACAAAACISSTTSATPLVIAGGSSGYDCSIACTTSPFCCASYACSGANEMRERSSFVFLFVGRLTHRASLRSLQARLAHRARLARLARVVWWARSARRYACSASGGVRRSHVFLLNDLRFVRSSLSVCAVPCRAVPCRAVRARLD